MHILPTIAATRAALSTLDGRIAFVPTMGNLHAGHLSLVEKARELADHVVVSIFVNPLQFGPHEDFAAYPRTLREDCAQLEQARTDFVFAPDSAEIYPHGTAATTTVQVPELSDILCGAARPGHFSGVATVVLRLFNIIQPHYAVFGEKDFQQVLVIRRMVKDLQVPVEIISMPTLREADGLAMSSRNQYLSPAERQCAPMLAQVLHKLKQGIEQDGERDLAALEAEAAQTLQAAGFATPDYVRVRDAETLGTPDPARPEWVVLAAARLGKARLIDNLRIHLPETFV
jgi:pantoate--beta-alanine ligase